jgi:hypothetical protein
MELKQGTDGARLNGSATSDTTTGAQPVVVSVSRLIKAGSEAAYEEVVAELSHAASQIPGYLGRDIFRPTPGSTGGREYHVVLRFDHQSSLRNWEALPERAALIARADALTQGTANVERVNGLEAWFDLPERPHTPPPPKWKTVVVSAVAIFVLLTFVPLFMGPLTHGWPRHFANAATAPVLASLMTYLVMPPIARLFKGWLYPQPKENT